MADQDPTHTDTDAQATEVEAELSLGQALIGTVVADRYRVERLLGEGAMGAVYEAEHIHMQKAVALKVLHQATSQNPEVVRRFEREAIAAGRIEHPNVAGATDFGRLSDGSFYLVLEFIDGQSLGQLMEVVGAMPPDRACRIAVQIAAALAAAHAAGIVHRDLKPENVMMPQSDVEGADIVKVLDFGMAKLQQADNTETKLTMFGAVYGTPQYMAPEQAAGQEVDQRADLYALGLMLYEMLSGKPPFDAETMMALLVKQMTETPAPLAASVPRPLARLVLSCLEKKPEDRPQSADEIVDKLTEFLGGNFLDPRRSAVGILAHGPGFPRRAVSGPFASWIERLAPLQERLLPLWTKVRRWAAPLVVFLKQPIQERGLHIPRWVPAAVVLGFLLVILAFGAAEDAGEGSPKETAAQTKRASASTSGQVNKPKPDPHPPDPELAKVIQSATMGSDSALYALEQRDDDQRSITEWLGLSKARLMNKKIKQGISAFEALIEMEPSSANDKVILGALRRLADQDEYAEPIITFAADHLGSAGADMLFHIWAKTSLKTNATTLAFERLNSSEVQDHFSPALKVAMRLRDAESCEQVLKQLPDIERYGDDRTLTKLRPLLKRRGCGPAEQKDCYPCLRSGKELESAMQAAGMRKAPQFELEDFHFKK